SKPEMVSAPENVTVTSVLFQPVGPGTGDATAEAIGAVRSIFFTGDETLAELPARSSTTTVPLTFTPSPVNTRGLGIEVDWTPDKLSAVVKASATSPLFQPAAFAAGDG